MPERQSVPTSLDGLRPLSSPPHNMPTNLLLSTYVLTGGDVSASWPSSFEACSVQLPETIDVDTRRGATCLHR